MSDPAARAGRPWTVRVAAWSARHRWLAFGLWFVVTLGLFGGSLLNGGIRTLDVNQDPNEQRLESEQAYEVYNAGTTAPASERLVVVVAGAPGVATDPTFKAGVETLVANLAGATATLDGATAKTFTSVIDPYVAPPAAELVAPDGSAVRIVGTVPGERDQVTQLLVPVPAIVDAARAALPAAEIHVISATFINRDIVDLINGSLDSSLRLTIPITFLILLVAFGAIVAALVPLVLAISALAAAFGLLGLYSQTVGAVSANASQLIILIGLAVAVDYSLFMVTRFRTERRRGRSVPQAIEVASSTAGRAVFFSGLAVMISLAGLVTLGVSLFTSMAVGTIGVVLVSVLGSLTFLPATLAILGDRVNRGRPVTWVPRLVGAIPHPHIGRAGRTAHEAINRRAARPEGTGFWASIVAAVMARPIPMTVLSTAVLLALAAPILGLRVGLTDITGFPRSVDGVAGLLLVNERWPQGTDLTLDVVVTNPSKPEVRAAIDRLETEALAIPGLSGPAQEHVSANGTSLLVSFTMAGSRNDDANRAIVNRVRTELRPSIFGSLAGQADVYVSGQAATALDITNIYVDGTPRIVAFVLGLSFLLMLVAFRSIVIPVKAILLNLLSTAAAFGVLVLVFRDGVLADQLGVVTGSVIESWVPIFIFTILFGLSMDYHLFILTRIKEARDRGLDSRAAVAQGITVTSGTITSAASIMVVVFSVFVTFKFVFIQELGLGLAVAVLIDATLIRSVLLPATMTLLGDWNWWLPRFLRWLPVITIESGAHDGPEVDEAELEAAELDAAEA